MGKDKGTDYLPVEEMKEGYLYKIDARNAGYGIWFASEQGFVIRRLKFSSIFLFTEIHWDLHDTYGTVKPLMELEKSPFVVEDIKRIDIGKFSCIPKEDEIIAYLEERTEFWDGLV